MKYYFFLILVIALSAGFLGCRNQPIGTPCERKGDGFTARHHCKSLCMSIWTLTCPDGTVGDSHVCGGELQCEKGSCPSGQVCYQTNMDRSICIPASICPDWSDPSTHPEVALKYLKQKPRPKQSTAPAALESPS